MYTINNTNNKTQYFLEGLSFPKETRSLHSVDWQIWLDHQGLCCVVLYYIGMESSQRPSMSITQVRRHFLMCRVDSSWSWIAGSGITYIYIKTYLSVCLFVFDWFSGGSFSSSSLFSKEYDDCSIYGKRCQQSFSAPRKSTKNFKRLPTRRTLLSAAFGQHMVIVYNTTHTVARLLLYCLSAYYEKETSRTYPGRISCIPSSHLITRSGIVSEYNKKASIDRYVVVVWDIRACFDTAKAVQWQLYCNTYTLDYYSIQTWDMHRIDILSCPGCCVCMSLRIYKRTMLGIPTHKTSCLACWIWSRCTSETGQHQPCIQNRRWFIIWYIVTVATLMLSESHGVPDTIQSMTVAWFHVSQTEPFMWHTSEVPYSIVYVVFCSSSSMENHEHVSFSLRMEKKKNKDILVCDHRVQDTGRTQPGSITTPWWPDESGDLHSCLLFIPRRTMALRTNGSERGLWTQCRWCQSCSRAFKYVPAQCRHISIPVAGVCPHMISSVEGAQKLLTAATAFVSDS